jgi:DNA-binding NarL/FixJ family response regulator
VVAKAGSVAEAREEMTRADVDVALVDIRLPDGFGTSLVAEAAARGRPSVLMLSTYAYPQYIAAAVRLGAQGFILKTAPTTDIAASIRRIAAGGTAFTADQLRASQAGAVSFTERERDVLRLVLASRSNDEIAMELGLSRKTVESHLTRLFERFEVTSRVELALRAEREGWLELVQPQGARGADRTTGG